MRAIPVLFSLLLLMAVGCDDTAVSERSDSSTNTSATSSTDSITLDQVDAVGLEAVLAANSVTLINFTATW